MQDNIYDEIDDWREKPSYDQWLNLCHQFVTVWQQKRHLFKPSTHKSLTYLMADLQGIIETPVSERLIDVSNPTLGQYVGSEMSSTRGELQQEEVISEIEVLLEGSLKQIKLLYANGGLAGAFAGGFIDFLEAEKTHLGPRSDKAVHPDKPYIETAFYEELATKGRTPG